MSEETQVTTEKIETSQNTTLTYFVEGEQAEAVSLTASDNKPSPETLGEKTASTPEPSLSQSNDGSAVAQPEAPKRKRRTKAELQQLQGESTQFNITMDGNIQPPPKGDFKPQDAPTARPIIVDESAIKFILHSVFNTIAIKRGSHWKLSAEESKVLIPPATRVANKYAPLFLVKYADEIALLTAVVGIVYVRIDADMELNKQREKEAIVRVHTPPPAQQVEEPKQEYRSADQLYPGIAK